MPISIVPIAGDFDLASWVTGEIRVTAPRDYFPELEDLNRQTRFEIQKIINSDGVQRFEMGATRFQSLQGEIESRIRSSIIDEEGRDNALRHVSVFFKWLVRTRGQV
ncbi:MAG TPA: hypothetical protein EYQ50_00940 [Verrucomicrobiales bacterium]|jgi:hypothetical protein|nr:hypothetical protein [Verrucomicrobiales bacterium]HIL72546.1 hypothetical protein [Verrucomicrobiota bacterium]